MRQIFLALFGYQQRSGLIVIDMNINKENYFNLYAAFLPDLLKPGNIFMHDNASSHTAKIVRDLLRQLQIKVIIWPPTSPDLNPIKNL